MIGATMRKMPHMEILWIVGIVAIAIAGILWSAAHPSVARGQQSPNDLNSAASSAIEQPQVPDERRVFYLHVHGIYFRNKDGSSRRHVIRQCKAGDPLLLVPEPDNPHDPNAIKVCRKNGDTLGYISRVKATRLIMDISTGWTFRVTVDEIYSFDDKPQDRGCRIRMGVLTMSKRTKDRRKKQKASEPPETGVDHLGFS